MSKYNWILTEENWLVHETANYNYRITEYKDNWGDSEITIWQFTKSDTVVRYEEHYVMSFALKEIEQWIDSEIEMP